MTNSQVTYDPKYSPNPEVLRLLELSRQEVDLLQSGSQTSYLRVSHRRCVRGPHRTRRGEMPEMQV